MYGLDEIYSSTSNRAVQTATPTSEMLKLPITQLDFANEGHAWRELTIKTPEGNRWLFHRTEIKELFHTPKMRALGFEWYKHPAFSEYDYKSGIERIQRESDAFFESLGYKHEGDGKYKVVAKNDMRVALFAHQGFGLAFLSSLLDIPYPLFCTRFDISHSGVTVIHFPNDREVVYPKILQLSNDSHLYKEDILTGYHNVFKI
jgi:probable phosphoglycerate mutase